MYPNSCYAGVSVIRWDIRLLMDARNGFHKKCRLPNRRGALKPQKGKVRGC